MSFSSQELESFVPVYDAVPESWEEGRMFLVEQLKKISNAVNAREIGYYLDEELLSGKQFISSPNVTPPEQFRSVFRKVVLTQPLVVGMNTFAHGITFDVNFTLIQLWASATNSTTFIADTFSYPEIRMNATDIIITSPAAYDRCLTVIEYIKEI